MVSLLQPPTPGWLCTAPLQCGAPAASRLAVPRMSISLPEALTLATARHHGLRLPICSRLCFLSVRADVDACACPAGTFDVSLLTIDEGIFEVRTPRS